MRFINSGHRDGTALPFRRQHILILIAAFSLLLSGCAELTRKDGVPAPLQEQTTVSGMAGIRYWADRDPTDFVHAAEAAFEREQAEWRASGQQGPLPPAEFLAVSGGGEDGAFGAGLLVGWSAAGNRPKFKAVTGIGDLYRIYIAAQRDGIDYNLAYIPRTFTTPFIEPFDTEYMNELFDVGHQLGCAGYSWAKLPPGFTAPEIEPPLPPPPEEPAPSPVRSPQARGEGAQNIRQFLHAGTENAIADAQPQKPPAGRRSPVSITGSRRS